MTALNIKKDSKLKSGVNLMIVQFALYFIPLITIPYVVKTVGIGNYGKYAFFQAVVGLLSVLINYGFIQTGVRDISVCRGLKEINREFSNIMYCKLLALVLTLLLGLGLFISPKFQEERLLYSYSFLSLLVISLDTSFVYQGIEKLKDYVNINLAGTFVVLILLFTTVRRQEDYVLLPVVFSLPRIAASLFSIYFLHYRFRIIANVFSAGGILEKLRSNFNIFAANIFVILYTRATQVILGIAAGNEFLGYYVIADQLVFAYSNIQGKVSTVYQPQIAQAFKDDFKDGVLKARENAFIIFLIAIAGFLFTQFFSREILYILYKEHANFSETVLRILSFNFVTMHLSYIMGMQILLSLYKDSDILRPSIYAAVLNLTLGSLLIYYFRHVGAAVSVVVIECLICAYFHGKLKGYGITFFDRRLLLRLFNFVISLALILSALKLIYAFLELSIFVKFPALVVLYGLLILLTLKTLNMVDFKNRKVIVEHVSVNG